MEEESNNPDIGTAELSIDEAVERLNSQDSALEDSNVEQPESDVDAPSIDEEPTAEEAVETPEETYFDIDGEQVSLTEIRDSYMRNAAFTQKSQQLAEERRAYQDNMRDVNEVRQQAIVGIEAIKQDLAIQFRTMDQPDWEYLVENEPAEYLRQQNIWQKREASVRQLYEAETRLRAEQAAYEEQVHAQSLRESNARFYEKYPELKDQSKAETAFEKITGFLVDTGFKPEEIQGISDFRIIDIMYQFVNMLDKQTAVKPVVQRIEQKPLISQKNSSRSKVTDVSQAAYAKFQKSGSFNDAVAYLNSNS